MDAVTSAGDALKQGNLEDALATLQADVRNDPANSGHRIFLFQLLCVTGQWDRALTQLNTAAEMNNDALLMAQAYREVLQCERFREEVFAARKAPLVFGDPPAWIGLILQSLQHSSKGEGGAAKELVLKALDSIDERPGTIDDTAFSWLSDADMKLGPVMEAIIDGKYYWVPYSNISTVEFPEPADLRDLIWLPANFTWTNEGTSVGFVPARYCVEHAQSDSSALLARKTEWIDIGDDFYTGVGQRTFTSGDADYSMLSTRKIQFDSVSSA